MKQVLTTAGLAMFSLLAPLYAQKPASPAKHPVETLYFSGIAAFNAHDLNEFMKQFHDEMQMFDTSTGWLRDVKGIRQRYITIFRQFPSVRMEIGDSQVREVIPGTAIVDFTWTLYPAGSGPAYKEIGTGVYVRRNGKWSEAIEHETVVTSADPAFPS